MHPDANLSEKLEVSLNTKPNTKPSAKKVALIYTGGTLGMELKAGELVASNLDASLALPDAWLVANNICVSYVENQPIDSASIELDFYLKLAKLLRELAESHHSLVVLQGTDTMEFSASAIAFLCRDIKKPIVFTGAQLPIFYPNSDATENIQNAILWSLIEGVSGSNISFGDYLIKGVNSYKLSSKKLNAFHNFSTNALGEIQKNKENKESEAKAFVLFKNSAIEDSQDLEHKLSANQVFDSPNNLTQNISQVLDIFCTRIGDGVDFPKTARIRVFPNMDEDALLDLCKKADLIFIEAYASGTIPKLPNFLNFLQERIEAGVKVILLSQSLDAGVYQALYSTNLQSHLKGVFSGANMTFATAYAKAVFLWCAEIRDTQKWQELWQTDFVGEFAQNQLIAS